MELALVLDVSGSMNKPEKIGAAKSAAQDMIDILYGDEETLPNTWVAVIPFSGRVNIRDYGGSWIAESGERQCRQAMCRFAQHDPLGK